MKAIEEYKKGRFNQAYIEQQADGSQLFTLTRDNSYGVAKFRVRNLYQPGEEELDIDTGEPPRQTKGGGVK